MTRPWYDIDIEEFAARGDRHVPVLDVRTPDEYAVGHVPEARNVPLDQLAEHAATLGDTVYVICASGRRSLVAVHLLLERNVTAYSVNGGTHAWADTGRPLSTATTARRTPPTAREVPYHQDST
jgi:rhodanese-related sulfurtransferase